MSATWKATRRNPVLSVDLHSLKAGRGLLHWFGPTRYRIQGYWSPLELPLVQPARGSSPERKGARLESARSNIQRLYNTKESVLYLFTFHASTHLVLVFSCGIPIPIQKKTGVRQRASGVSRRRCSRLSTLRAGD